MPHGKGELPTLGQEAKKLKNIIEHELPVTEDAGREMAKLIKSCSLPELSALGLAPPPLAALSCAALTANSCIKPMAERLQAVQDVISSLQYNHQNCYLYNVNKQRPLAAILATAAGILKDPLPIKCIEAVFLGILLTQGWDDLQRIPVGFKSRGPDGKVYRHIVLVVCQVQTRLYGAIGLSRRPELMYKPLQFDSLADIMADYQSGYRHWGHELIKVRVGLPVEHCSDLLHLPVCWRYCTISPTKRSWQRTAALLNQHADASESLQSQYRALASTSPTCRPYIRCGSGNSAPPTSPRHSCQPTRRNNRHPLSNSIDIGSLHHTSHQVMTLPNTSAVAVIRDKQPAASRVAAAILSPRYAAVRCSNHIINISSITSDCVQLSQHQQQTSVPSAAAAVAGAAVTPTKVCEVHDAADPVVGVLAVDTSESCDSSDSEVNAVVDRMRHMQISVA